VITPSYVRLMAEYNAEMNRRLYGAAARLTDAERKADRGAFWSSIHGTLAHILWGDSQWMSRFDNWPKPDAPIKQSAGMVEDFAELRQRRIAADAGIESWADRVDDEWLAADLVWFSGAAACGTAAAIDSKNPRRAGCKQFHHALHVDLRGRDQFLQHNAQCRFQADNAKRTCLKLLHLLAARMRRVIGCDRVDGALDDAFHHGLHIATRP